MISLLDVNVLVALAWPNHIYHVRARAWFGRNQERGWATTPLTQSGFVRVSSNRHVLAEAKSPGEAILLLRRIVALRHHAFWPDDISIVASKFVARERLVGYGQVTDAHLLAVALRYGGRLATFDEGVSSLVPKGISLSAAVVLIGQR